MHEALSDHPAPQPLLLPLPTSCPAPACQSSIQNWRTKTRPSPTAHALQCIAHLLLARRVFGRLRNKGYLKLLIVVKQARAALGIILVNTDLYKIVCVWIV
jgi:hypothetical protein